MKLRNKKTGKIMELSIKCENGGELKIFDLNTNTDKPITLAELNRGWEDYEEPKTAWFIDCQGGIQEWGDDDWTKEKSIGNYFETKEEAEKAVEKLKAWKRLKDGGFVFCGKGDCLDTIKFDYGPAGYNNQDFNLLFGGEE